MRRENVENFCVPKAQGRHFKLCSMQFCSWRSLGSFSLEAAIFRRAFVFLENLFTIPTFSHNNNNKGIMGKRAGNADRFCSAGARENSHCYYVHSLYTQVISSSASGFVGSKEVF